MATLKHFDGDKRRTAATLGVSVKQCAVPPSSLELPRHPEDVQQELNIAEDASYVISIKNPEAGVPRAAGLSEDPQAKYPKRLQKVFRNRRFCECDPPDFLNREGTEFLLVAASEEVSEDLGVRLDTDRESRSTADMFKDFKLDKSQHPLDSLLKGEWEFGAHGFSRIVKRSGNRSQAP